jgi:hypothetical protein
MLWMRRWLLFTVGVPILAWVAERTGQELERRNGRTDLARALQGVAARLRAWRGRGRRRRAR